MRLSRRSLPLACLFLLAVSAASGSELVATREVGRAGNSDSRQQPPGLLLQVTSAGNLLLTAAEVTATLPDKQRQGFVAAVSKAVRSMENTHGNAIRYRQPLAEFPPVDRQYAGLALSLRQEDTLSRLQIQFTNPARPDAPSLTVELGLPEAKSFRDLLDRVAPELAEARLDADWAKRLMTEGPGATRRIPTSDDCRVEISAPSGWRVTKPEYPATVCRLGFGGSGQVQLTTNAKGHVFTASMSVAIHPEIDAQVLSTASTWSGPPNESVTVLVTFTPSRWSSEVAPLVGTWSTPKPPYPPAARQQRAVGSGLVLVTTDAAGRVVQARLAKSIHPLLDEPVLKFARAQWRGPANTTKGVPISFQANE